MNFYIGTRSDAKAAELLVLSTQKFLESDIFLKKIYYSDADVLFFYQTADIDNAQIAYSGQNVESKNLACWLRYGVNYNSKELFTQQKNLASLKHWIVQKPQL